LYSCAAASSMFAAVITLQSYLKSSRSLKDIPQILTPLADFRLLLFCSSPFIFVPISWFIEPTPLFHVMFLSGMVFNQIITTSITHNARLKEFFNHKQTSDYVAEIRSGKSSDISNTVYLTNIITSKKFSGHGRPRNEKIVTKQISTLEFI